MENDILQQDQFEIRELSVPDVAENQALVRVKLINIHANTRRRMALGEIKVGGTDTSNYSCAQVVKSRDLAFKEGDLIACQTGWQEYQLISSNDAAVGHGAASELTKAVNRTNSPWTYAFRPAMTKMWPPEVLMEIFGTSGMTAFFGLRECGPLMPRDRALVAGATGSVGSIAAQLAKAAGTYVVGFAGGRDRCAWVKNSLGIDGCIDYQASDLRDQLKTAFPDGVDVYCDGVGGRLTEAVTALMSENGRLFSYGAAAAFYADKLNAAGPRATRRQLFGLSEKVETILKQKNIKSETWMVDAFYHERLRAEDELSRLLLMEKLKPINTVVDGFEHLSRAIVDLYRKRRSGKLQVRFAT
jgi:NADPH-dependent curcumin reductase CurA